MKQAIPYLMFSGNCREALTFYADCLGGEITSLQTAGESPLDVPDGMADRVFDSEFRADNLRFKASDDMPGHEVTAGSNFALFVTFDDRTEQKRAFNNLAEGGHVQFPLDNNFGMLVDKFRIQ